jgi:hypothetical protein
MTGLLDDEMIRFTATPVSPFVLRHLPLLGRLYRITLAASTACSPA